MRTHWMMASGLVCLVFVSPAHAAGAESRLLEALKNADTTAARALVEDGADVNVGDAVGVTPLHWAVQTNDLELATMLLRAGARATAATRYGVTPLALACTFGIAPMIELLLASGADPNQASALGETVLMLAGRSGGVEAVTALLARGADVNARTEGGQTALMWAADEDHAAAIRVLLDAGAGVNARTDLGFTALLFAARDGQLDAVRTLVRAGADVNDQIWFSRRPSVTREAAAMTAALGSVNGSGYSDAEANRARLIIKHSYTAPDGDTALGLAIINGQYDVAQVLVEHGADPNAPDPRGSMLHALAYGRRPGDHTAGQGGDRPPLPTGNPLALAEALLEHGADPNVRIAWEEWPFDIDASMTRLPINLHVGRTYLSNVGATPYYLAAKHGDVALMRLLVTHGADPSIPTVQNVTPLMAAAGLGYWEGESPGPEWGTSEREALEAVKLAWEFAPDQVNAKADLGDLPPFTRGATDLLFAQVSNLQTIGRGVGDLRWAGSTALHGAAVRGQPDIVEFLIEKGAQIDAKNDLGWTPFTVAGGLMVGGTGKPSRPEVQALLVKAMQELGLEVPAVVGANVLVHRESQPGGFAAPAGTVSEEQEK